MESLCRDYTTGRTIIIKKQEKTAGREKNNMKNKVITVFLIAILTIATFSGFSDQLTLS